MNRQLPAIGYIKFMEKPKLKEPIQLKFPWITDTEEKEKEEECTEEDKKQIQYGQEPTPEGDS